MSTVFFCTKSSLWDQANCDKNVVINYVTCVYLVTARLCPRLFLNRQLETFMIPTEEKESLLFVHVFTDKTMVLLLRSLVSLRGVTVV